MFTFLSFSTIGDLLISLFNGLEKLSNLTKEKRKEYRLVFSILARECSQAMSEAFACRAPN